MEALKYSLLGDCLWEGDEEREGGSVASPHNQTRQMVVHIELRSVLRFMPLYKAVFTHRCCPVLALGGLLGLCNLSSIYFLKSKV